MSDTQYRTVIGAVQFDPEEKEVNGKQILKVSLQQAGFGPTAVRVGVTFWADDFPEVDLSRYDVVLVEGKYTSQKGKNGQTYHNLSASRFIKLGQMVTKESTPVVSDDTEDVADDDIPF